MYETPDGVRTLSSSTMKQSSPVRTRSIDPSAYVPELSRRARGFATWAMIRQFGRAGIGDMVERCCTIASHMGETLGREQGVALVSPVTLNQFMLRFDDDDAVTLAVVAAVQAEAVAYIGSSQWRGQWVMRVSVSSCATTMVDADRSCRFSYIAAMD